MTKLIKEIRTTFIPADPGFPGFPGKPAVPEYTKLVCTEAEPSRCFSMWQPVYCADKLSTYSYLCGFSEEWGCTREVEGSCVVVTVPAQAEQPAIPAVPPTPAETIINLQAGWNASAQSIASIYPDEAYLFKIGVGANGVLVGVATEPWVPNAGQLPYGIMFSDGAAQVFEMNVAKEPLGNFFRGEEFIIGRGENYILYYNMTAGKYVIRSGIPAAATVPLHLFAMMYLGGDTVII